MEKLSAQQVDHFVDNGYVKVENAFAKAIADECRYILWKATGCDPDDRGSWTKPVIRIGEIGLEPFKRAANTAILHTAFDQLVGKDNWYPRDTLGSFPIRFPCKERATDTGWHVDASFPGDDVNNYLEWRINIKTKGRALLQLFLFSDVTTEDGPTIIRVGSHLDIAKMLEPEGERGLSFMDLARKLDKLPKHEEVLATGKAGTVYLCHPFLVHAAQDIRGTKPKFMAQPPLLPKNEFNIKGKRDKLCPVELAILKGVEKNSL